MARTIQPQRRRRRRSSRSKAPRPVVPLRVGDWLDVMDTYGMWNVARVLSRPSPGEVEITYDGWPDEFDEVVHIDSHRVAPYHTFTYAVKCWVKYLNWPMWPAVVTISTPGTEEGINNLKDEQRFYVDFFDHPDFKCRDRCWQLKKRGRLSPFGEKDDERRRGSHGSDFECSLKRALQSDATTRMPAFAKGMLPVEYENATTRSVEEMRKSMGEELWRNNFLNNRERHYRTHVYDMIGGVSVNDGKKRSRDATTSNEAPIITPKQEDPPISSDIGSQSMKESLKSRTPCSSSTGLEEKTQIVAESSHELNDASSGGGSSDDNVPAMKVTRHLLSTQSTTAWESTNRVTATVELNELCGKVEISSELNDNSCDDEGSDVNALATKKKRPRLRIRSEVAPEPTKQLMPSVELEQKSSSEVEVPDELSTSSSSGESSNGEAPIIGETRHRQIPPSPAPVSKKFKVTKYLSEDDCSSAPTGSTGLEDNLPEPNLVEYSSEDPSKDTNDQSTKSHRRLSTLMNAECNTNKRDAVTLVAFTRNANSSSKTVISVPRKFGVTSSKGRELSLQQNERRMAPPPPLLAGKSNPRSGVALVSPSTTGFSSSGHFLLESWFRRKLYSDFMTRGSQ